MSPLVGPLVALAAIVWLILDLPDRAGRGADVPDRGVRVGPVPALGSDARVARASRGVARPAGWRGRAERRRGAARGATDRHRHRLAGVGRGGAVHVALDVAEAAAGDDRENAPSPHRGRVPRGRARRRAGARHRRPAPGRVGRSSCSSPRAWSPASARSCWLLPMSSRSRRSARIRHHYLALASARIEGGRPGGGRGGRQLRQDQHQAHPRPAAAADATRRRPAGASTP